MRLHWNPKVETVVFGDSKAVDLTIIFSEEATGRRWR